jgi:hypothetical protein
MNTGKTIWEQLSPQERDLVIHAHWAALDYFLVSMRPVGIHAIDCICSQAWRSGILLTDYQIMKYDVVDGLRPLTEHDMRGGACGAPDHPPTES